MGVPSPAAPVVSASLKKTSNSVVMLLTLGPFTRARADFQPGPVRHRYGYFFIMFTWTRVEDDSRQPGSAILNPG